MLLSFGSTSAYSPFCICSTLHQLASMAEKIAISKDWIVVICEGDKCKMCE